MIWEKRGSEIRKSNVNVDWSLKNLEVVRGRSADNGSCVTRIDSRCKDAAAQ